MEEMKIGKRKETTINEGVYVEVTFEQNVEGVPTTLLFRTSRDFSWNPIDTGIRDKEKAEEDLINKFFAKLCGMTPFKQF